MRALSDAAVHQLDHACAQPLCHVAKPVSYTHLTITVRVPPRRPTRWDLIEGSFGLIREPVQLADEDWARSFALVNPHAQIRALHNCAEPAEPVSYKPSVGCLLYTSHRVLASSAVVSPQALADLHANDAEDMLRAAATGLEDQEEMCIRDSLRGDSSPATRG